MAADLGCMRIFSAVYDTAADAMACCRTEQRKAELRRVEDELDEAEEIVSCERQREIA